MELLSLGNRVFTFLGKSFQLCLPSVHFVAALLYLSVFPFGFLVLVWIWLYQFLSSLIYYETCNIPAKSIQAGREAIPIYLLQDIEIRRMP